MMNCSNDMTRKLSSIFGRNVQSCLIFISLMMLLPKSTGFASPTPKSNPSREPWDVLRFVQQSSKFISLPSPWKNNQDAVKVMPGDSIWKSGSSSFFQWSPLDDVVMGGVSTSNFDNQVGKWKGTVSESNSGGFIGIRSTPFNESLDLSTCKGIEFKLLDSSSSTSSNSSQKRRFKAVVRDSTDFNGISWTSSFDVQKAKDPIFKFFQAKDDDDQQESKGAVTTIQIPFQELIPTKFAKIVPDQAFNLRNVVGFQLVYSKFEYEGELNPNFSLGDFSLQVMEIKAY